MTVKFQASEKVLLKRNHYFSKGRDGFKTFLDPTVKEATWYLYQSFLEMTSEKEIAIHSSILAWRILWTEEPGGLESIGSQKVGHN